MKVDMNYDELERVIDLKIAASLERIGNRLEFEAWVIIQEEIELLRTP